MEVFRSEWHEQLSKPEYEMDEWEKAVPLSARDGTRLYVDICRPKAPGRFPALLAFSPYGREIQHLAPPPGRETDYTRGTGGIESGMSNYFVPRGYVHVHGDPRGVGISAGEYTHFGEKEQQDGADIIEWIAQQPWCNGNVGMVGHSYFAKNQWLVASQQPPHLKAIFVHEGYTDMYRHVAYHGGILNFGFYHHIWRLFPTSTTRPLSKDLFSPQEYQQKLDEIRADPDIRTNPYLYKLAMNPEQNPLLLDLMMHPFDGPFYHERSATPDFDKIKVPVFMVSRWSGWTIHLPGIIEANANLKVPHKLVVAETPWEGGFGRPWFENHDLVVRWYDYWLKGINNGVMDDPPVRIFVKGSNVWREEKEWPPARAQYVKYYLRERGVLSTQPPLAHGRPARFRQDPWQAEGKPFPCLTYTTEPFDADTEFAGPIAFHFWASLDTGDANWFAQIMDIAPSGEASIVSKGWLKASHRELDTEKSTPERPYHKHVRKLPTRPGEIHQYDIPLRDTCQVIRKGHRLQLLVRGQDAPWEGGHGICYHVTNAVETEHTIYNESRYPSHVLMPLMPAG